ncbi:hypothetical protein H2200_004132 [Cladophialophora chaetospira]|uniref:5'-3' DNA helicase ZGRF1-like N-terminal domain-containing protein n=1 Tax=Cladophialophora chaetospira TaxID=386627 RepID=A0AA38XFI4_9EURO|nr:hypothetical protein H2200_004132 [Cladophialophora chaetospira]
MATLTSTHRGFGSSASLTVAPTENTAPVHEFRCLYTRDLHKKAKKWHDGSLKFHAFNRRVMAYDDDRVFIGDLHYRQEEDFGEGIELRLDRGVLVEVGERLGETQTDLAPILDRNRTEKAPSPRGQPAFFSSRPQPTAQSQRPKSLMEVLGPSQSRRGRARILYQSPYEQRHTSARVEPAEPPQKRQRLSSDKENNPIEVRQPARPARPSLPQPVQPSKPVPHPSRQNEPPIEFEEVFDLSPDEEPRRRPSKPATLTVKPVNNSKAQKKHPLTSGHLHPKQPSLNGSKASNARVERDKEVRRNSQSPTNPKTSTTRAISTASRLSVPGTARLLLSLPKSRRKLTCTLPFQCGPSIAADPGNASQPLPRSESLTSLPSPEKESLHAEIDSLQKDKNVTTLRGGTPSPRSITPLPPDDFARNSSPLFMPENDMNPGLPPRDETLVQDEFPFSDVGDSDPFESLDQLEISHQSSAGGARARTPETQGALQEQEGTAEEAEGEQQRLADRRDEGFKTDSPIQRPDVLDFLSQTDSGFEPETRTREQTGVDAKGQSLTDPSKTARSERLTSNTRVEPGTLAEKGKRDDAAGQNRRIEPARRTEEAKAIRVQRQVEAEGENSSNIQPPSEIYLPLQPRFEDGSAEPQIITKQPAPAVGPAPLCGGRPFRRVLSENDALEDDEATLVPRPAVPKERSPLQVLENLSTQRSSAKFKSPMKVQRCASDTLALKTAPHQAFKPTDLGGKGPTGPWTIDEAFLLFEIWPTEIEKPPYWADTPPQRIQRADPEPIRHDWGGITTARQFLRDDVNVL